MKGQETLFSKKSDIWSTPKDLYDQYVFKLLIIYKMYRMCKG